MNAGQTQIVAEPMATSVTEINHLEATLKELNECQSDADIQGLSERVHTIMSQISGNGKKGCVLDAMKEAALALKNDGQKVKSNRMNKMRKLLVKLPSQSAKKQRKMLREVLNLLGKNIGVTIGHKTGFCGVSSLCCNAAIVTASVFALAGATAMVVMGAENVFEENAMTDFQESTDAVDNTEDQDLSAFKVESKFSDNIEAIKVEPPKFSKETEILDNATIDVVEKVEDASIEDEKNIEYVPVEDDIVKNDEYATVGDVEDIFVNADANTFQYVDQTQFNIGFDGADEAAADDLWDILSSSTPENIVDMLDSYDELTYSSKRNVVAALYQEFWARFRLDETNDNLTSWFVREDGTYRRVDDMLAYLDEVRDRQMELLDMIRAEERTQEFLDNVMNSRYMQYLRYMNMIAGRQAW